MQLYHIRPWTMNDFYPGKRLSTRGDLCTVRYVGAIAGKKGSWLGVEWDDATRGKHTGTFDGLEYFKCTLYHESVFRHEAELTYQAETRLHLQDRL